MGRTLAESLRLEQQGLVNYWDSKRRPGDLPGRRCFHPGEMSRWLSGLSILEFSGRDAARFRLVGTHVREAIGFEPAGRHIDEIDGLCVKAWREGVMATLQRHGPISGLNFQGSDISHAWLRLPIRCEVTGALMVLCHDRYPQLGGAGGYDESLFGAEEEAELLRLAGGDAPLAA